MALLGLRGSTRLKPILYALLVGFFIAAYTLLDKQAVTIVAIPPILVNWGTDTLRAICLSPLLLRRRSSVRAVWRAHWKEAAPLREVSVILVVFLGAKLLGERDMWKRLMSALGVILGTAATVLGR